MKKTSVVIGLLATALSISVASAGAHWPQPLVLDTVGRTANGALGTVYNSTETVSYIGCNVQATAAGATMFCSARDAAGLIGTCSSSNPAMVQVAASLHGEGVIYVAWDASGNCTTVRAAAYSLYEPKKQ